MIIASFFFKFQMVYSIEFMIFGLQEKAPYVAKAEKRKSDYEVTLKAYNKKLVILSPYVVIFC